MILRWRNMWNLIPIWTNVYFIPERVNEYNPNYFVCLNTITQGFEIHSIAGGPNVNSREVALEFDELDVRTLYFLQQNDLRVHGRDIFRRIEASEERARMRKKRDFSNWVQSVARETRTAFKNLSYGLEMKGNYRIAPVKGGTTRETTL